MPFCVGITGGIGSGKSSAAEMFAALGAAVVDTDAIARELTQPGGGALTAIRDAFGAECIAPDGGLERAAMRRLVFRDPAAKARLEAILHPLIRAESRARLAAAREPYVIVVVPLLFETGAYEDIVDRVLVVDCSEDEQIRRTIGRSGLQEEEVRAIMAAQLPRAARLERADDVLHNDKGMEALREQVLELHAKYLTLARP
ncbi:MAG: dephospho-CoA kinase [Betaproteobacteria bacterium]|nr:dephospho-CoA kinase [Betaproteobacteria bacterium]